MTAGEGRDLFRDPALGRQPVPAERRAELLAEPGFGRVFTDHMVTIAWTAGRGWHDAQLRPYGPFSLDPACQVFHYGQEIFEGLKAYRQAGGPIATFRPRANAARFAGSAAPDGACPNCPRSCSSRAIELLVTQDRDWVPDAAGAQPLPAAVHDRHPGRARRQPAVAVIPVRGHRLAGRRLLRRRRQPVSVWLADDYTRAAPGGTGAAKTRRQLRRPLRRPAAGHRPRLRAGRLARRRGAPLGRGDGRDEPVLRLRLGRGRADRDARPDRHAAARHHQGLAADARPRPRHPGRRGRDLRRRVASGLRVGEITEVFACGTAAVITPVGAVKSAAGGWTIGDGEPGPVTMRLREHLLGIQFGQLPDPHGWVHKIC